jgi:hypothetical protein
MAHGVEDPSSPLRLSALVALWAASNGQMVMALGDAPALQAVCTSAVSARNAASSEHIVIPRRPTTLPRPTPRGGRKTLNPQMKTRDLNPMPIGHFLDFLLRAAYI